MNSEHDPRCSYWVDQLCTCHHIAALEEEAKWVQESPTFASPSRTLFGTMVEVPGPWRTGTYTSFDPLRSKSWADEEAEALKKYHMAKEEARAEIYAKADALRKKTGGIY